MTAGARALLYGTVFFATVGVAMWAVTLPAPWTFLAGAGWMLVLVQAHRWEQSLGLTPRTRTTYAELVADVMNEYAGPRLVPFPEPRTLNGTGLATGGPARWEEYRLNHRVDDLATLPCRYGCVEPVTCPYPHSDCPHCLEARDETSLSGRGDAVVLSSSTVKAIREAWPDGR